MEMVGEEETNKKERRKDVKKERKRRNDRKRDGKNKVEEEGAKIRKYMKCRVMRMMYI